MKRRKFLRHLSHTMAIPGLAGSLGLNNSYGKQLESLLRMASAEGKALVLIFLEGGNDGLNTLIPLDAMSALSSVRPHVVMPESKLIKLPGQDSALHPALQNFKSFFTEGRLGIIQSVGYPEQNFSHFRSTDIWMSGSNSNELINSGWAGRYLNNEFPGFPEEYPTTDNPDPLAIEIGNGGSLLFQGPSASMGMVLSGADSFYKLINNEEEDAPETNAGDKLRYVRLIARQSEQYGESVVNAANKVKQQASYAEDNLSQQLKVVSRLIAGGLKTPLYLVRLGGFDTHDNQVESSDHTIGEHADLLKSLNDGITSFMNDLEFLGIDDQVIGMTFSEFGRRIISNASLGTDHGSAAPLFVFGNAVKGGILGSNPVISRNSMYDDNIEMQFDFRQIYASVLSQWFEKDNQSVDDVMLGSFEQVPIIGDSELITNAEDPFKQNNLKVFPNPLNNDATIRYQSDGSTVKIELINMSGKKMANIYQGPSNPGENLIKWKTQNLPKGNYILLVQGQTFKRQYKLIK